MGFIIECHIQNNHGLILPVAMEKDAIVPNMTKANFLGNFLNIIVAKGDTASLIAPWIIAWCSGLIAVFVGSDANCGKKGILLII